MPKIQSDPPQLMTLWTVGYASVRGIARIMEVMGHGSVLNVQENSVSSKRILVVDDTEDVVKVVRMYLEHHGYEVITTNDGQEGLEKAKTEKPDLIVLDLMLPRMNGYKVCGLLKRDTRYAKIPIILFTAKTQEKDIKLGEEVGADAYITKPFEPEVLLSKIEELIKEPRK